MTANLERIDLSHIKAIAYDGRQLQVLVVTPSGFSLNTFPASRELPLLLRQLAAVATVPEAPNGSTIARSLLHQIPMISVPSALFKAIGYCHSLKVLQIDFLTGSRYRYFEISQDIVDAFLHADKKIKFFHDHIHKVFLHQRIY